MHNVLRLATFALITALAAETQARRSRTFEEDAEEIEATKVDKETDASKVDARADPTAEATDGRSPIDGVVGHFGIGYFTSSGASTPIGMRYWLDRENGLDVGVDLAFESGDGEAHRYGIEAGYVMALAHYHYSVVFARAGVGFVFREYIEDRPVSYDINANFFVGAELFLGAFGFPNVSLQGGIGVEANFTHSQGSRLVIGTANGGLSVVGAGQLGFHIYL